MEQVSGAVHLLISDMLQKEERPSAIFSRMDVRLRAGLIYQSAKPATATRMCLNRSSTELLSRSNLSSEPQPFPVPPS